MDLDVDVARLKLMKASHQSQQYKLEDNILRHFPQQIEECTGFITRFNADMRPCGAPYTQTRFRRYDSKGGCTHR
jgi:hypothetical protein